MLLLQLVQLCILGTQLLRVLLHQALLLLRVLRAQSFLLGGMLLSQPSERVVLRVARPGACSLRGV